MAAHTSEPGASGVGTVLRSLNNNAVLVTVEGQRRILMGRGIGFRRRLGDDIPLAEAEEIFTTRLDESGRDIGAFLNDIPLEVFECCRAALNEIGPELPHSSQVLLLALADHLHQAIARTEQGITLSYPTSWEVPHLYPQEMRWGRLTVEVARRELCPALPDDEATAFAMHYVNAHFTGNNLARTIELTELLNRAVEAVQRRLGADAPQDPLSVARFVTHLRYLFVRIMDDAQITRRVMAPPPDAHEDSIERAVADVQAIVENSHGVSLSDAEVDYLRLHILRLSDPRAPRSPRRPDAAAPQ
ncbi:PRD domain-containing protein [Corynebacterium uropygiale]|uniref:PRD domain-containing protein n=1 Tax=Corynebacterium uropygiale TaxID=1775911 RepID=A0A9X1QT64_9CORY|nr:PRD domain-containing protein [Corynebacterium uropygiale]MCF4007780.1 PRD domain-containing protein [Corynebacterium uropygiale]